MNSASCGAGQGAITCQSRGRRAGPASARSLVADVTHQLTRLLPPPSPSPPGLLQAKVTLAAVVVAAASSETAAAAAFTETVAATMAQYKGAASEAGRAMHLMKKREKQREQMEQMKQRIAEVWARPGHLRACAPRGPPGGLLPLVSGRPQQRALSARRAGPALVARLAVHLW